MICLSVNLNKIALLRNARNGDNPSITEAAKIVIASGASGITVHPRPDQRHIRPDDIAALTDLLTEHNQIEFNIEGNPHSHKERNGYPGFSALIESARPHQATLVPDSNNQLTSDHGWDLRGNNADLVKLIKKYRDFGSRISLFIDPNPEQITIAKDIGVDRIELFTGPYAHSFAEKGVRHPDLVDTFSHYKEMAEMATDLGLGVNAGHDLDMNNLKLFKEIDCLLEVSIGQALITDALKVGLESAVKQYVEILNGVT